MLADIKGDVLVRNPTGQWDDEETKNQAKQTDVSYGAEEEQSPRAIAEVVKAQGQRQKSEGASNHNNS